jgi:hypothetical protein
MYYICTYIDCVYICMPKNKLDLARFSYSAKTVITIVIMYNALVAC